MSALHDAINAPTAIARLRAIATLDEAKAVTVYAHEAMLAALEQVRMEGYNGHPDGWDVRNKVDAAIALARKGE